jgi:RNA 2',3'-cyclic 3'-phosphodiesterase
VRLFVAVRPGADALAHAAAAVDVVRREHAGPRWIPSERWHLTLAFYGEVPDAEVDRRVARLDRVLGDAHDMSLALVGAGAFARRAVWLGVAGDVGPLRAVARTVSQDRSRPYRPHLSVARLRGDTDPTAAVAALSTYDGPVWTAGTLHLVRSRPGSSPTYDDVATWSLGASSAS